MKAGIPPLLAFDQSTLYALIYPVDRGIFRRSRSAGRICFRSHRKAVHESDFPVGASRHYRLYDDAVAGENLCRTVADLWVAAAAANKHDREISPGRLADRSRNTSQER